MVYRIDLRDADFQKLYKVNANIVEDFQYNIIVKEVFDEMDYYRIRKQWNGGKWSSDQRGAYTSFESAREHITDDMIADGYKIFSPTGEILFPIAYNETATTLYNRGFVANLAYWSDVLDGKAQLSLDTLKQLCQNVIDNTNPEDFGASYRRFVFDNNGYVIGHMFKPEDFCIQYIDAAKSKLSGVDCVSGFNLGYFGNYKENGKLFTLPAANLVADIDVTSVREEALQYLRERKITPEGKLHFSASTSTPEFRNKQISTLVIYKTEAYGIEYKARMEKLSDVTNDEIEYAVSGAPIIWNGRQSTDYLSEGWDSSITRSTYHGVLGLKGQQLYYFKVFTTSKNCIDSGELYEFLRPYELTYAIKVDGGGSFYANLGDQVTKTSENRRINNVGIVRY